MEAELGLRETNCPEKLRKYLDSPKIKASMKEAKEHR